jgi:hypothetical protein
VVVNKATPAADPLPRPTTRAGKIALFKSETQFLEDNSTR